MTVQLLEPVETVDTTQPPVLEFVAPMPGFPHDRRFVLVALDDTGMLYSLQSVDRPQLRFLVAPPAPFFPDYSVEVDDATIEDLGVVDPSDVLVLLVINAGDGPADASANLMAPIVLARHSLRAVQVILGRSGLPVRAPLFIG
ncbi:flagellar assembly protein FliW [Planosporangium thailandense]|uniref:Flagellar assembly factor FliW n=1 Tax=Planosporangium thailandense TaxID=765197 RepID=A0ABX0Y770_9ACTN|nr:flagellar assembly protein FliW [Planosporangium thailandense]NJC74188.1 flagellar assembly protein FliW [Planosporangium thailandense]